MELPYLLVERLNPSLDMLPTWLEIQPVSNVRAVGITAERDTVELNDFNSDCSSFCAENREGVTMPPPASVVLLAKSTPEDHPITSFHRTRCPAQVPEWLGWAERLSVVLTFVVHPAKLLRHDRSFAVRH